MATAIAGLKPGEYSQLGLPLPSKVRNIGSSSSRDSIGLPYRGKYGIVSLGSEDDEEGRRILVGPDYLAEARLSDKGIDSNDEEDDINASDKVDFETNNRKHHSNEVDGLKRPVVLEEEKDEDNKEIQSPYGVPEYGKYPLFPVAFDRFSFPSNPYFLPISSPNSYVPLPIANQYLQRRAFNPAAMRYPQIIPQSYPSFYGQEQYNPTNASPYAPFRVFYAQ